MPGEADGTYKLHHGGWVLLVFGTHTLRTADNGDNVQSFRLATAQPCHTAHIT